MDLCKRAICAFNQQTNKPRWTRSTVLTSGCHGNTPSGFIPLLSSQHMWVCQGRVMSFYDFYLLQPYKHRLTLISVLNTPPWKASESGPSPHCPSFVFFLNVSATCCPPLSRQTQRLEKLMASRGWGGFVCAHRWQNLHKNCFTSKLLLSFDDILKNEHRGGIQLAAAGLSCIFMMCTP